jgi:putative transposase
VNRKRVQRLMRLMGLRSVAPTPNTGKPAKKQKVYPYLLRNTEVPQPSQVWATDITYLCLRGGFVYLVAIMDWYSRKVLSWKLSSNMESSYCVSGLERVLRLYPVTELFNSDQGSQFTSQGFTDVLIVHDIQISMDGKHHLRIAPVAVGKIRGTHLKEYESAE